MAGQAALRVIHTAHREHAGNWENMMFVYLCRTVRSICILVSVQYILSVPWFLCVDQRETVTVPTLPQARKYFCSEAE